ncbi:hypothetical protein Anapl_16701 [Anas platyrhynchos]|uniref:Uncharacterized protein n=1 Tax=Anas platyrhynchos TaxID=8839 RepID=R0KMI8_ANAPL|nr:hypothetical protein Anapl_16701 [Anas platyrhynchos]
MCGGEVLARGEDALKKERKGPARRPAGHVHEGLPAALLFILSVSSLSLDNRSKVMWHKTKDDSPQPRCSVQCEDLSLLLALQQAHLPGVRPASFRAMDSALGDLKKRTPTRINLFHLLLEQILPIFGSLPVSWQNHYGKSEKEDVWDMVAPEEAGFIHYSRKGNRDADSVQDNAQDTSARGWLLEGHGRLRWATRRRGSERSENVKRGYLGPNVSIQSILAQALSKLGCNSPFKFACDTQDLGFLLKGEGGSVNARVNYFYLSFFMKLCSFFQLLLALPIQKSRVFVEHKERGGCCCVHRHVICQQLSGGGCLPAGSQLRKVAITKAKVDFSGVVCLPPSVIAGNGLDGGGAGENDDEPVLVSLSAAPSPQSEAVANELQELSLQPELTLSLHHGRNPNLPPLSERKNALLTSHQPRCHIRTLWYQKEQDSVWHGTDRGQVSGSFFYDKKSFFYEKKRQYGGVACKNEFEEELKKMSTDSDSFTVKQLGGLCLPQQRAEEGAHVDLEALDTKEIPSKRICI